MNDYKSQIQTLLGAMKQAYIERNPYNIEPLINLLFDKASVPIIIGTSTNEWCFGIDEAKKLFLSDWEGWGNVTIDLSSLSCECLGTMAWFHVKAGVEYSFKDTEERFVRYMDSVKRIAKATKTPLCKTGEITWLLSHLLSARNQGVRKYVWDMTITGMLQNTNDCYKMQMMQFSLPVKSAFTDVRIDTNEYDAGLFEQECIRIKEYNADQKSDTNEPFKNELASLFDVYNHFQWTCDGISRYIGFDGIRRDGNEFKNYLIDLKQNGISAQITPDNMIVKQNGDAFCFCGVGTFTRNISLDTELETILKKVADNGYTGDTKDALFKIRRDLTLVLKEASLSDGWIAPFRMEGMGRIAQKKMCFDTMQLSYPFSMILEQRTDCQIEI